MVKVVFNLFGDIAKFGMYFSMQIIKVIMMFVLYTGNISLG